MNKFIKFIKPIFLFLFLTIISISAPNPDKYRIYDSTEHNKPIVNIIEDNKINDGLVYNKVDIYEIARAKQVAASKMYNKFNYMFPGSFGFPMFYSNTTKVFTNRTSTLINNILNNNSKIEYNPNAFQSGTLKDITNFEDGISDIGLIKYIYNTYFEEPEILNYNNLNDFYYGTLDQFSQSAKTRFLNESTTGYSLWKGTLPKTDRIWKTNGHILSKPDLHDIDLDLMVNKGLYPYELTNATISTVKSGDVIIVDLLDDGYIDFSGIAFSPNGDTDVNSTTRTWIYPIKDKVTEYGYYTRGVIPITTQQQISNPTKTSTGESVVENVDIVNRVIVIPSDFLLASMDSLPKPLEYIYDIDDSFDYRMKFAHRLKPDNTSTYMNIRVKTFTNSNIQPSYKVTTSGNVLVEVDAIKEVISTTSNTGATPYIPFKDDAGVNSMLNDIIDIFISGFNLLPKLLLTLIIVIFVIDLMFMALKEIKMAGNGVEGFITKAFDKIVRYAMVITMLVLYPMFLTNIFFPFVISRLPVYILDLANTYSFLNITKVASDGNHILHFPGIWWAMSSSVLGSIWSLMAGRLFAAIVTLFFIFIAMWFFPVWTVRFILTKILVIAPFIVVAVVSAVMVAINVVANIFMSAIFMIIVTIMASIYFVFGVSDLYIDKFILILKILLITMFQYVIQVMLLVITLATFESINKELLVTNVGGIFDILPLVIVFTTILIIIRVPTKISRTLEQSI